MLVYSIAIKPRKKGPMQLVHHASITIKEGIVGDCRGGGGMFGRRQVTLISLEQWWAACLEVGQLLPVESRRANICICGHLFGPQDKGKRLYIRDVVLEITGETKPCSRMDEVAPGLQKALQNWRGGVTCQVITGGTLADNCVVAMI